MLDDDLTQLRRQFEDLEWDLGQLMDVTTAGTTSLVAQIVSAGPAGHMFAFKGVSIDCKEEAGAIPTLTTWTDRPEFALHLGTTAPSIGDIVIITQIGGLWMF